jgi:hypothetical protein
VSKARSIPAWLALIRLPNLVTVPGDVLAGCVLVGGAAGLAHPSVPAAVMASLLFYIGGLIMNDLADRATDQRERPDRPLPSGAVSVRAATWLLGVVFTTGLILSAAGGGAMLAGGVALVAAISGYNLLARVNRVTGALGMGLCRALNLALGVVAARPEAWSAEYMLLFVWWWAYVAAVTWLASREMAARQYGLDRWLPLLICVIGGGYVFWHAPQWNSEGNTRAFFCLIFAAVVALQSAIRLGTHPVVRLPSGRTRTIDLRTIHPPAIGMMISALIPMQAAVVVGHAETAGGLFVGFLLLIAWPLNRWLARAFAAS